MQNPRRFSLSLEPISEEDATVAQAQGMLMGRFDVLPDEARDLLAMAAEQDHLSSYAVARKLVTDRKWCS
jgi:hypothetical protein